MMTTNIVLLMIRKAVPEVVEERICPPDPKDHCHKHSLLFHYINTCAHVYTQIGIIFTMFFSWMLDQITEENRREMVRRRIVSRLNTRSEVKVVLLDVHVIAW